MLILFFILLLPLYAAQEERGGRVERDGGEAGRPTSSRGPVFSIISPLFGEKVEGNVLFMIKPHDPEHVSRATLRMIQPAREFEATFLARDGWMVAWDAARVENGEYVFEVEVCARTCTEKEITVHVKNPETRERPPVMEATPNQDDALHFISITPSNWAGAFTLRSSIPPHSTYSSSGDPLRVSPGVYSAHFEVFDAGIQSIHTSSVRLEQDGTFATLTRLNTVQDFTSNGARFRSTGVWAVELGYASNYTIQLSPAPGVLPFACEEFDSFTQSCEGEWKPLPLEGGGFRHTTESQHIAWGWGQPVPAPPVDARVLLESRRPAVRVEESLSFRLEVQPLFVQVAGNDFPTFDVRLLNQNREEIAGNLEYELFSSRRGEWMPFTPTLDPANPTRVQVPFPTEFHPGEYAFRVRARAGEETVEVSVPFEWGLMAVNTKKSIYKPGEVAEFEIVVLDKESLGVKGANLTLTLLSPGEKTILLSSEAGTILETTSPGIYLGQVRVEEEGTYTLDAHARASGIDTQIQTTFDVYSHYAFDIVRNTHTKIDPAVQPIHVEFTVAPFSSAAKEVTIREYVPADFNVTVGTYVERFDLQGEPYTAFVPDARVRVYENENGKVIEWSGISFETEERVSLSYAYTVPDKKPWLYVLGPMEIIPTFPDSAPPAPTLFRRPDSFWEARGWMIAVDANPTSKLFFRRTGGFVGPFEPSPNDSNCSVGCDIASYLAGVQSIYGLSDINGGASDTNAGATSTTAGIKEYFSAVSYPLVRQTIVTNGTWMAGIKCALSSTTDNNSAPAFAIYRWIASTDSNGQRIVPRFNTTASCPTTAAMRQGTRAGAVSSVTFERGDKVVVEVLAAINSTAPPPTSRTLTYTFGNTGSSNDGNVILPSGVTLRFAGDLNTEIVSPSNGSSFSLDTPFDVNARGSCKKAATTINSGFACGDVNVSFQYCIISGGQCGTFFDLNTVSTSPLYISDGNALKSDDDMSAGDVNYFVSSVVGTVTGTYTVRSRIDGSWSSDINYSNFTGTDINVTITPAAEYSFVLLLPSSGCTTGKGNITGGNACQKGYFEPSDLSGFSDENKVNPEGQTELIPFLVYDNQSTSASDLNILFDLNASLPAALQLKVSKIYAGWNSTCMGNTDTNCLLVSTTATNIGTAPYSTGTQDLNIFIWTDFIGADVASYDRNVDSNSIAP